MRKDSYPSVAGSVINNIGVSIGAMLRMRATKFIRAPHALLLPTSRAPPSRASHASSTTPVANFDRLRVSNQPIPGAQGGEVVIDRTGNYHASAVFSSCAPSDMPIGLFQDKVPCTLAVDEVCVM